MSSCFRSVLTEVWWICSFKAGLDLVDLNCWENSDLYRCFGKCLYLGLSISRVGRGAYKGEERCFFENGKVGLLTSMGFRWKLAWDPRNFK
jgi:hypothetical protein